MDPYLIAALIFGLLLHGATVFTTLEGTYDALIHLFFSNHYATDWFAHWNQSWYTGFTVYGYPPLVHQLMAAFSFIGGLKFGLYTVSLLGVLLFVSGVYRFALLLSQRPKAAGYAAILAVASTSFIETLHLFGQLPSIIGMSLLLHACPEVYRWVRYRSKKALIRSWVLIAIMVCSHHVTPIFGMVFFLFPIIGMALMDLEDSSSKNSLKNFILKVKLRFWPIVSFGAGALALIIFCILPYWLNTKNNPITQIPIPHGSRDNFFEVGSSGLVFFLVPWGLFLLLWPFTAQILYKRRLVFFGLSFGLLALLGTGGTTPIPELILGENAFNILTLDRFTLWATLIILPIAGIFAEKFFEGSLREQLQNKLGRIGYRMVAGLLIGSYLIAGVATLNLGKLRPSQPDKIDMLPIVNFLNQDEHYKWRYLTLGFGDQMAWLSAQTKALSVDGNYHSARKLPELTTKSVERLENSKFRGIEGLGSLQQFLANPNKYNLKYVFSNDKFYDPVLHFSGWKRLPTLENGISVWEREGVNSLPSLLDEPEASSFQQLIWGLVPLSMAGLGVLVFLFLRTPKRLESPHEERESKHSKLSRVLNASWVVAVLGCFALLGLQYYQSRQVQASPEQVVMAYFDAMDFKEFERAHSYLDPLANKTLDRFMLEIAITDGLLSSYGKLESISTELIEIDGNNAKVAYTGQWITALKSYSKEDTLNLNLVDGKWYIVPEALNKDIPKDVFVSKNELSFFGQGRRRNTLKSTFYEDVMKRPEVEVLEAKLIQKDGDYFIIGRIKNSDYHPASLLLNASLFDQNGDQLAKFAPKDAINYRLLPQQETAFKIGFEEVAWLDNASQINATFDPEFKANKEFNSVPYSFELNISTTVTSDISSQDYSLSLLSGSSMTVDLLLFNSTTKDCTIPQFLVQFYTEDLGLTWIETFYGDQAIRPYRYEKYAFDIPNYTASYEIIDAPGRLQVNGRSRSILDQRIEEKEVRYSNLISGTTIRYRVQLNGYSAQ